MPELPVLLGATNHTPPASHTMVRIQASEATPELVSITMDEIHHQVVGDDLPLVDADAHSSETGLPCLPELSGTTVPTKSLGAAESLHSPAWPELPHLPTRPESPNSAAQPESPHLPRPESPDFWTPLETTLEPTSTSLDDPAAGMLDHLVRASRTFGPCWMSSLY